MDEDLNERLLKANANPAYIADRFADVLRNLVRAVAANDPSRPVHLAAEDMRFVSDLLQRCDHPLSWYSLFADAVRRVQATLPDGEDERRYVQAAKDGMKYVAEASATDNAARGRASRRLREFLDAIERLVQVRR